MDGMFTETTAASSNEVVGNTRLVDYGIQNEESDLRAHVCPLAKKVYVYRTSEGARIVALMQKNNVQPRTVLTGTIVTATGYPVRVFGILGVKTVDIPQEWLDELKFSKKDSTSEKGRKAVVVVRRLIRSGIFPLLPVEEGEVEDEDMQIKGVDIIVSLANNVRIQTKLDYQGGNGEGCTGNLFLQVSECNPFHQV